MSGNAGAEPVSGTMERVQKAAGATLAVVPMLQGTYLFKSTIMKAVRPLDARFDHAKEKAITSCIVHSSGTSRLPKPVPTWWRNWPGFLKPGTTEKTFENALVTAPLYHGFGIFNVMRALYFGHRVALMNANLPTTRSQILTALKASKCTSFLTVPYHLLVAAGKPGKAFTTRSDGGYDTKDLFMQHPTNPHKWKYVSRKDDTIVLVNGEKADPLPLEDAVKQHPDIQAAAAFGAQRGFLGMVVLPEQRTANVPKREIIDRIWPNIQEAIKVVPAYARISRGAIVAKDAGTPLPLTEKLSIVRPGFVEQFAADIDALYARLAGGGVETAADLGPRELSESRIRDLVRKTVCETLQLQNPSDLTDDADFFLLGMDSLRATQVRSVLAKGLSVGQEQLPQNVAFENPSVARLAQFIVSMTKGAAAERSDEQVAMDLLQRYSHFAPASRKRSAKRPEKEVVVLTGATGSLGCHVLNKLLLDTKVQRVYCLVRADNANNALHRTYETLKNARLLPGLSSAHKDKIIALPSDLSQEHFALPPSTYDEIAASVTTVIHNAWTVNFNMSLASFEPHCIRGTYHLLNLCLRSPFTPLPTFAFVSTIGAVMGSSENPAPERLMPFSTAGTMGYSQSKWIAEQICAAASKSTGIATRIVRIGQIVGDTQHGMWNPKEAVPLTVQAALTIGALPLSAPSRDRWSWLPVDVTATAVIELATVGSGGGGGAEGGYVPPLVAVFHVCHPRTISWNDDFLPALRAAGLEFEAVAGPEWVRRLESSEKDPQRNPPMKLINWFRGSYGDPSQAVAGARNGGGGGDVEGLAETTGPPRIVELDTTESRRAAPSLREPKVVGREEMVKYLRYWREEAWAGLPLSSAQAKARM